MDETLEDRLRAGVVRSAAGVLAGVRPAALFNIRAHEQGACADVGGTHEFSTRVHVLARELDARLRVRGVRLDVLVVRDGRALLLAWRAGGIAGVLRQPGVRDFLARRGYTTESERRVVGCLRRRLRAYELGRRELGGRDACEKCPSREACRANPWREELDYPHEVGVLLGYPLSDVRAFIERRGAGGEAVGAWKAYGDVPAARAAWERLRVCERETQARFERGATLEELIA